MFKVLTAEVTVTVGRRGESFVEFIYDLTAYSTFAGCVKVNRGVDDFLTLVTNAVLVEVDVLCGIFALVTVAVAILVNVLHVCLADFTNAVVVFIGVGKSCTANVTLAVAVLVDVIHSRSALVTLSVAVGIAVVLVTLAAVNGIVGAADITFVVAVLVIVVKTLAALITSVVAVRVGVVCIRADKIKWLLTAVAQIVVVAVVKVVYTFAANITDCVVSDSILVHTSATFITLVVAVGVRVIALAIKGVLGSTKVAFSVGIFVIVVETFATLVTSVITVCIAVVGIGTSKIEGSVTGVALVIIVVIGVNEAGITPFAFVRAIFQGMYAFAAHVTFMVSVSVLMLCAVYRYLFTAHVAVSVFQFVNVPVGAGRFATRAQCNQGGSKEGNGEKY